MDPTVKKHEMAIIITRGRHRATEIEVESKIHFWRLFEKAPVFAQSVRGQPDWCHKEMKWDATIFKHFEEWVYNQSLLKPSVPNEEDKEAYRRQLIEAILKAYVLARELQVSGFSNEILKRASIVSEKVKGPIFTSQAVNKVYENAGHNCALRRWLVSQFVKWHCSGDIGGLANAMRGDYNRDFFRDVIRNTATTSNGKASQKKLHEDPGMFADTENDLKWSDPARSTF